MDEHNVYQPDVLYFSRAKSHLLTKQGAAGAPDLVVEVLSHGTSARDLRDKRKIYHDHSVNELWFVNPWKRTVTIERLGAAGYETPFTLKEGQSITTPLFPDWEFPLGEVFLDD